MEDITEINETLELDETPDGSNSQTFSNPATHLDELVRLNNEIDALLSIMDEPKELTDEQGTAFFRFYPGSIDAYITTNDGYRIKTKSDVDNEKLLKRIADLEQQLHKERNKVVDEDPYDAITRIQQEIEKESKIEKRR